MSHPIVITRRFEIDAGHRLQKHESKCRNLHGHRYTVEVSVTAAILDEVGRIIDFGVIKEEFGAWLNEVYDHGFIVEEGDPITAWLVAHEQKHHVMKTPPSIENLVAEWFKGAKRILEPHRIEVVHVRGYETAACWADFHAPLKRINRDRPLSASFLDDDGGDT